jgi:XTP/dITP diphosphohydrolase
MKTIILATSNKGKIKEIQALLPDWSCILQTDLNIACAEETGLSFIENAILKARHASHCGKAPSLADDSGLVVPALGGAPGIYSARFAGINAPASAHMAHLLSRMENIPLSQRDAYFYCAMAYVKDATDPTPLIATGLWRGQIALAPQGDAGFGYDPIFYLQTYQCTAAELPKTLKNTISHRAIALKQLRDYLC